MQRLEELLDRCKAATGPDRGLDEAIMGLFYTRDERHIGAYIESDFGRDELVMDKVWVNPETDKWVSTHAFDFTSSVDAVLALIEAKLPRYRWGVSARAYSHEKRLDGRPAYIDGFRAHVTEWSALRPMPFIADALTPPLALLCALLSALIAKEAE